MLRLILMRHAKSDWSGPGLEDHDRPLNARGRKSAIALGDWLRQIDVLPDEILCSTSVRTCATLAGLGLPDTIVPEFQHGLYLAEPEDMLGALQQATGETVLMIGHNPGTAELAHRLVALPPDHDRFDDYPTGATLVVDFDAEDWNDIGWHDGQPKAFVVPRELTEA